MYQLHYRYGQSTEWFVMIFNTFLETQRAHKNMMAQAEMERKSCEAYIERTPEPAYWE
jgi:hypothetical protein